MFSKLLTSDFWFQVPFLNYFGKLDSIILWLGVALVVAAIFLRLSVNSGPSALQRQLRYRWFNLIGTIGIITLVWAWLRYEGIPYLATHLIIAVVFLAGLVWLIYILKYQFGEYRTLYAEHLREKEKQRYL